MSRYLKLIKSRCQYLVYVIQCGSWQRQVGFFLNQVFNGAAEIEPPLGFFLFFFSFTFFINKDNVQQLQGMFSVKCIFLVFVLVNHCDLVIFLCSQLALFPCLFVGAPQCIFVVVYWCSSMHRYCDMFTCLHFALLAFVHAS